ncbi:hypothetical protein ACFOTA_11225 [Chitinophaga sp. GCM10012297]|uniref:DUF3823 domain-containing protein n=1 Tax=Chitinophaga chungangae TaxID=2821488 RepID=A0ABS3YDM4_9BACT|nr:hypothetical protein [Chitinophaga chungangae]MBO9152781.1 hypothetical protein [Chitinophaga chungangae]
MKRRPLAALFITILLLAACKKESSLEEPFKPNYCDYAPYSTGSVFSYEMADVLTGDTLAYTLRVEGDTTYNNEPFRKLTDDFTGEYSLFRCGGGNYEQLLDVSAIPDAPPDPIKTVYLKDDLRLGEHWEELIPVSLPVIGDVNITITYTIIQKGTSKTVLAETFSDVIGVRMEVSVPPVLPPETLMVNYYAKGVGLIQVDRFEDTTRLKSYTIE